LKFKRKVGGNINIDKMINMLLLKLSKKHDIFFMEKRNYRDDKVYKTFIVKIDKTREEFRNKRDLLMFLSKM
jgi:hypothetical protein